VKKLGDEDSALQALLHQDAPRQPAACVPATPVVQPTQKKQAPPVASSQASGAPNASELDLDRIILDLEIQPRLEMDDAKIKEYEDLMADGVEFAPVVVFSPAEGEFLLSDGWHRYEAAKLLEKDTLRAEIRSGGKREAILYAIQANTIHGIKLTREEKQQAAKKLLADPEWQNWSDKEIGRQCGLSGHTIGNYRAELNPESKKGTRKATRNGKTLEITVGKMGRPKQSEEVAVEEATPVTSAPDQESPSGASPSECANETPVAQGSMSANTLVSAGLSRIAAAPTPAEAVRTPATALTQFIELGEYLLRHETELKDACADAAISPNELAGRLYELAVALEHLGILALQDSNSDQEQEG
jgi:hypothetical protein